MPVSHLLYLPISMETSYILRVVWMKNIAPLITMQHFFANVFHILPERRRFSFRTGKFF